MRLRCGCVLLGDTSGMLVAYKVTNTANGKLYFGITKLGIRHRVMAHFSGAIAGYRDGPLHRAIRKYGAGAFTAEVVYRGDTVADLAVEECRLIDEHKSYYGNGGGYNASLGGDGIEGSRRSLDAIEKTRAKLTGRKNPLTTEMNRARRRFTEDDIRAILLDGRTCKAIATDYGTHSSVISAIFKGQIYDDLFEKILPTLPPEVVERNAKYRSPKRPWLLGDLHHMRRDPELARRTGEKKRGNAMPHTAARNISNRSLTEDQIRAILSDTRPARLVAEEIGKSLTLVYDIRAGKKYADVVAKIKQETV